MKFPERCSMANITKMQHQSKTDRECHSKKFSISFISYLIAKATLGRSQIMIGVVINEIKQKALMNF